MMTRQGFRNRCLPLALAVMTATSAPAVNAAGYDFQTLHFFDWPGVLASSSPMRLVLGQDGNLYGATAVTGTGSNGIVFRLTPAGTETVVHTFNPATDGGVPVALMQAHDGTFYGMTSAQPQQNNGTVFKLSSDGQLTTLHVFSAADDGADPVSMIEGRDGNFYGVTAWGGAGNYGTVFRLTPDGQETVLHSFAENDRGTYPIALAEGDRGILVGITAAGPKGKTSSASVFKLATDGSFATLRSFVPSRDAVSPATLIRAADGNFYGTLSVGSVASVNGSIFRLTPDGAYSVVYNFEGGSQGADPVGLMQGKDGNFYGTTLDYGTNQFGTVFELTPAGVHSVLHVFPNRSVEGPTTLLQAGDGSFYGLATRQKPTGTGYYKLGGWVYSLKPASP